MQFQFQAPLPLKGRRNMGGGQGESPRFWQKQLTSYSNQGADYAHHITNRYATPPGFSDLPMALPH